MKTKNSKIVLMTLILFLGLGISLIPIFNLFKSTAKAEVQSQFSYMVLDGDTLFAIDKEYDGNRQSIKSGDNIMLSSSDKIVVDFNKKGVSLEDKSIVFVNKSYVKIENPASSINLETYNVSSISVTGSFYGTIGNQTKNWELLFPTPSNPIGSDYTYNFILNLNNNGELKYKDDQGTERTLTNENMSGTYTVNIQYTYTDTKTSVQTSTTYPITFRLFNKDLYVKQGEAIKLINTTDVGSQEYSYNYNYANSDTTKAYPHVVFDTSLFDVNFTKTLSGKITKYDANGVVNNLLNLKITSPSGLTTSKSYPLTYVYSNNTKTYVRSENEFKLTLLGSEFTFTFDPANKTIGYSYPTGTNITINMDKDGLFRFTHGDINYAVEVKSQNVICYELTEETSKIVYTSLVSIPLEDLGYYSFSLDYLNAGEVIELPESDNSKLSESKTLLFFGYKLNYTSLDGSQKEMYDKDSALSANTESTNTTNDPLNIGVTIGNGITAKTNQAPLKFEYLGILNSNSSEVKFNDKAPERYVVGASFSKAGTYEVTINYTYRSQKDKTHAGTQVFKFIIDDSLSNYFIGTAETTGSGTTYTALNQKYINKNIYVGVQSSNEPFMAPVEVSINRFTSFDSTVISTTTKLTAFSGNQETIDEKSYDLYSATQLNKAAITTDGKYEIVFTYGASRSVSKHIFYRDTTPISGITAYEINSGLNTTGIKHSGDIMILSDVDQKNLDDSLAGFAFGWNEKSSGASSRVEFQYSMITSSGELQKIIDLGSSSIGLTNFFSAIDPFAADKSSSNIRQNLDAGEDLVAGSPIDSKNIRSALGIYFFKFIDEAGNVSERIVIYDTTSPAVLQQTIMEVSVALDEDNNYTYVDSYFGNTYTFEIDNTDNTVTVNDVNNTVTVNDETTLNLVENKFTFNGIEFIYNNVAKTITYYDFVLSGGNPNRVSGNTRIVWGDKKLIEISVSTYERFLETKLSSNLFAEVNGSYYIAVPATAKVKIGDETIYTAVNANQAIIYINEASKTTYQNNANYHGGQAFVANGVSTVYDFKIISNYKEKDHRVEMNFDASDSMLKIKNSSSDTSFRVLSSGSATNYNLIYYSFKHPEVVGESGDDLYVEYILLDYYPFTTSGDNYPFSTIPEKYIIYRYNSGVSSYNGYSIGSDIISLGPDANGYYLSGALNVLNGASKSGKYVFTRIYNINPSVESQDVKELTLTYYVDQNEIVSSYSGSEIGVLIGSIENDTWFFKEWDRKVAYEDTTVNFITNKLPAKIIIPASKYMNGSFISTMPFAQLSAVVKFTTNNITVSKKFEVNLYKDASGNYMYVLELLPSDAQTSAESNKLKSGLMNELFEQLTKTSAGLYEVIISDHTGFTGVDDAGNSYSNDSPTSLSFSFAVNHDAPSIIVKADEKEVPIIEDTYYTNVAADKDLFISWSDPTDPYSAKVKTILINSTTITVPGDAEIGLVSIGDEKTLNNVGGTGYSITIKLISFGTFEGKIYSAYSYKIKLSTQYEGKFEINLSYLDVSQVDNPYIDGTEDYSNKTYYVVIDRTKPDNNIERIIDNDNYLTTLPEYKQNSNSFKQLLLDITTQPGQNLPSVENYKFGIPDTYYLDRPENAHNYFYIRKLGSSKMIVSPDHYEANSPSREIFNEGAYSYQGYKQIEYNKLTTLKSQILSVFSGDTNNTNYYEIVEKDYAGNLRIYVLYVDFSEGTEAINLITTNSGETISSSETAATTILVNLNVSKVESKASWYKVVITNETTKATETIYYTPFDTLAKTTENKNRLNAFFALAASNTVFKLEFINMYGSLNIVNFIKSHIKIAAPGYEKIISGSTTSYNLLLPTTYPTAIELVSVKILFGTDVEYSWNKSGSADLIKTINLSKGAGTYTVIYSDNYTTKNKDPEFYEYKLLVDTSDLTEAEKYSYSSGNQVTSENITYTSSDVLVRFNSKIFKKVRIFQDDEEIVENIFTNDETIVGAKRFTLTAPTFNTNVVSSNTGGAYKFRIEYYVETADTQPTQSKTIVIYNLISGISVQDLEGNALAFTEVNNRTSNDIKINWNDLITSYDFVNEYYATLYTYGESGQLLNTRNFVNNSVISAKGIYKLTLFNQKLGYHRSVEFVIEEPNTKMYDVVVNNVALSPSPVTLDLNTVQFTPTQKLYERLKTPEVSGSLSGKMAKANSIIKQYFTTIKTFTIQTNVDNALKMQYFIFINGVYSNTTSTSFNWNNDWNNKTVTVIVLLYGETNPVYEKLFSVTIVPSSTELGGLKLKKGTDSTHTLASIESDVTNSLGSSVVSNSTTTLLWSPTNSNEWYLSGNINYLTYSFKNSQNSLVIGSSYTIGTTEKYKQQKISGAGTHTIKLYDWAGNIHTFRASAIKTSQDYRLTIIDSVVYTINTGIPIQNATFNGTVSLEIDSAFTSYYATNSLILSIKRNGALYTGYTYANGVYYFQDTGRYQITINAKYKTNNQNLAATNYNFSIINKNAARLAWEFNEISGYEIIKVIKDGRDITSTIGSSNITKLYISTSNANYGVGSYTIYVKAINNDILDGVTYSFSFKINDEVPVILSNPAYGQTTTGKITLQYNPGQIYEQLGVSSIRIMTYDEKSSTFNLYLTILITEANAGTIESYILTLDQTNDYYVQLVTDNENVALSFRINRAEPLNSLAIIIIVISVVAVVVLTFVFIKLRTRMKIR